MLMIGWKMRKTCYFDKGMDRYLDRAEGEGIYV